MSDYRPFDQERWLGDPPWSGHSLKAWAEAHGHDPRLDCYPENGCKAIGHDRDALYNALKSLVGVAQYQADSAGAVPELLRAMSDARAVLEKSENCYG